MDDVIQAPVDALEVADLLEDEGEADLGDALPPDSGGLKN